MDDLGWRGRCDGWEAQGSPLISKGKEREEAGAPVRG